MDQISKVWIDSTLELYQSITVLPFFNISLIYNEGAAWSFLADAGGWQRWFLSGVAIIMSGVILFWMTRLKSQQMWLSCAFALVLGGAVGNVIDRIIYGHVIDFIDVYYQHWHWPTFNIADSAISIGVTLLLIDAVFFSHKTDHNADTTKK